MAEAGAVFRKWRGRGPPLAAGGYLNTAYVGPVPQPVFLPEGKWAVKVMHGREYETVETAIDLTSGTINDVTIALNRDNPIDGWQGIEVGVRTSATPGVVTTADDIALMAGAEGLDWVVSGDFEHITDLAPSIAKHGLADRLKSSRGFRTYLPARPEWGQFLIFPVAADAPDPAQARAEWADLKTAQEFIATLRRLYPGALIQSDLPYTKEGLGYLGEFGVSPYTTLFEPPADRDLTIDAINVLSARSDLTPKEARVLYFNLAMKNIFLIPSTAPTGRSVYGAEPGYPRLLVYTGKEDSAVTEQELFIAARALKTQLTNGPLLDFTVGGARGGETLPFSEDIQLSTRVSAPVWMDVSRLSFDKEGIPFIFLQNPQSVPNVQRYPWDSTASSEALPIADMKLLKIKDTLLSLAAEGMSNFNHSFPAYPKTQMLPFAFTSPVAIDVNGNGVFDPITLYSDKGR